MQPGKPRIAIFSQSPGILSKTAIHGHPVDFEDFFVRILGSLAVEITAAGFLVAAMRKLGSRDESHQPLGAVVQKAA